MAQTVEQLQAAYDVAYERAQQAAAALDAAPLDTAAFAAWQKACAARAAAYDAVASYWRRRNAELDVQLAARVRH